MQIVLTIQQRLHSRQSAGGSAPSETAPALSDCSVRPPAFDSARLLEEALMCSSSVRADSTYDNEERRRWTVRISKLKQPDSTYSSGEREVLDEEAFERVLQVPVLLLAQGHAAYLGDAVKVEEPLWRPGLAGVVLESPETRRWPRLML